MSNFLTYLKTIIKERFLEVFSSGLNPVQLSKTIAVAITISIFPIYGVTTAMLIFISFRFKLNLAVLIASSYTFTPLQLILIPVFLKTGYTLFDPDKLALLQWDGLLGSGLLTVLQTLGWGLTYGVLVWIIIAAPFGFILFWLLKMLFCKTILLNRLRQTFKTNKISFKQNKEKYVIK